MPGATGWSRGDNGSRDGSTQNSKDNEIYYDSTPAYYVALRDQWTEHLSKAYERWTILGENFEISLKFPQNTSENCKI